MKYRIAGASYRTIAEKLTEDWAHAYADEHGVSFERAMKKIPHVSKRTVWDDVTAEMEELRSETQIQRGDLMALENTRLDQVLSKALALFANGSVPAGRLAIATMGRRCLFVAGSLPVRVPQRAGVEVRGARVVRGVAVGSESVPRSLGVGHSACSASRKPRPTDTFGRPSVQRSRSAAAPVALRALSAAVDSSPCFLISTLLLRELSRNQVSKKTLGRRMSNLLLAVQCGGAVFDQRVARHLQFLEGALRRRRGLGGPQVYRGAHLR